MMNGQRAALLQTRCQSNQNNELSASTQQETPLEAGDMAQKLRALVVLLGELGLISSTHMIAHSSSRGSNSPFRLPQVPGIHGGA